MPYPVAHVLFFLFCTSAVAVYAIVKSISLGEFPFRNLPQLLSLFFVGSLCTLFPDIMAVYNFFINGTIEHCWIGPIPTHSLLFSSSAIMFGTLVGYAVYNEFSKAIYLGLFAETAFLSHLLLDDIGEGGCEYIYPLYSGKISVFSLMDAGFQDNSFFYYMGASFLSVFFICFVAMTVLFTLNQFGFEFKYGSEK